jgi:transcriptional regulator with PAS, ATPase and Fis domain
MTIVDSRARVAFISPVHERFFGLGRGEAIGRPVRDVIENTRLHVVVQTGQPEIGHLQPMKEAERVVSRVPIYRDGQLLGAVGRVMFKGPAQVDALYRRINALEKQVAFYRHEATVLRGNDGALDEMIGRSPPIQKLRAEITTVAPLDVSVLVTGESGTGKELVARALHRLSPRAGGPLVTVNAAALPASLVESELFGYEAGAFTGADRKGRRGRFEQADGGTIFLDEIGDMPLDTQAKLLRVLQERMVERVGGDRPVAVDFRLVCATNRDLADLVARSQFRLDLFYRISSVVLRVPRLADRGDDVLLLARHLLAEFARQHGRPECVLDTAAEAQLRAATWPGNVRQLRHAIERAVIFVRDNHITAADLAAAMATVVPGDENANRAARQAVPKPRVDGQAVVDALRQTGGNKRQAAALLGISRSHLYNLLAVDGS